LNDPASAQDATAENANDPTAANNSQENQGPSRSEVPVVAPFKKLQKLKELQPSDWKPRSTERPALIGHPSDYMQCFYKLWDQLYTATWQSNFVSGYNSYGPEYNNLLAASASVQGAREGTTTYAFDTATIEVDTTDEQVEPVQEMEEEEETATIQEGGWTNPYEDEL
jgi:hypothetical protein